MQKYFTNITQMATPTDPKHLITKEFAEALVNRKVKDAVVAVATSNIAADYDGTAKTLTQQAGSEAAFVFDGVDLAVGDRVLVTGQTDATQNGIYVVTTNGAAETSTGAGDEVAGVLTRSDDFNDTSKIALNTIIPVQRGTQNADTTWQLTNDTAVTLDTTPLSFGKFRGSEGATSFNTTITGNGTDKEFTINHGLNTENVHVSIVDHTTKEVCGFDVVVTSANVVTIKSDVVLESTDSFDVTVIG